jgi:hypothetical protein
MPWQVRSDCDTADRPPDGAQRLRHRFCGAGKGWRGCVECAKRLRPSVRGTLSSPRQHKPTWWGAVSNARLEVISCRYLPPGIIPGLGAGNCHGFLLM